MPDWLTPPSWLDQTTAIIIVAALLGLLILKRIWGALRRRRPAKLHPNLAKYGGPNEEQVNAELDAALKIVATSSTASVAGYRIVRQIEAVFVDGCRSPGDAVRGLKAAAAQRGANAVINLTQERTAAGRCSASGDAVVVKAEA